MNTRQKAGAGALAAGALVIAFALGGHASYSEAKHRLSMASGATVQINCNGGGLLNYQQLQPTIGRAQCTPGTSTPTTVLPSTSTTLTPPTTTPPPDVCPLTIASRQCWEAKTGVPGWTEAQIVAGKSPLRHSVGDRVVTVDGTVIDGEWIDGCIAVRASNVTIRNSLIRTSNPCQSDGNTGPAAIAMAYSPWTNLQIIDTEVDAGQTDDGYDYIGIGSGNYSLLRVNAHGTTHTLWAGKNVTIRDSYIHDPTAATTTRHNETIDADSSSNVTIDHNWISAVNGNPSQAVTAALQDGGSWGPSHDNRITNNFLEGGRGTDLLVDTKAYNTTITGNRFSPNTAYGNQFTYDYQPNPGNTWVDNLNSETLAPVGP